MKQTGQLMMRYTGYKDRTFVPRKNQQKWLHQGGEKDTKEVLCLLNKIGNSPGATCTIEYLGELTQRRRMAGYLKRNHYVYGLIIEYQMDDEDWFLHHIHSRTGRRAEIGTTSGGCDSSACNGGFCD